MKLYPFMIEVPLKEYEILHFIHNITKQLNDFTNNLYVMFMNVQSPR